MIIRLPKHWNDSEHGDLRVLLKTLYGLRISPRAWYEKYCEGLESIGWVKNPLEPGLFRKNGMLLTVYVDDSTI